MLSRRMATLALGALLLAALPAEAKDICVTQSDQTLVFKKVKSLKKAGAIVPLSGVFLQAGDAGPITGTAFLRSDGQAVVGVTVIGHNFTEGINRDILIQMVVDPATFAGNGTYQTVGGGITSDSWATASCKEVVYP